ncbi:MAG: STAS/SEC14 domain-containing protein [Candidatus Omnitrophica bacterium]|nr:STAS/SEC14 domain-containing protein [Candidatus Omnitrophota bacterium]MDD5487891.1 STAS/SEC14 domain-containing protein [Candidatus Omnitrophota bacterium]
MGIKKVERGYSNVFGFEVTGKLAPSEVEAFLPEMEEAVRRAGKKLRLFADVTNMDGADLKSEWEVFGFLKEHMGDIELIAVIGAHSWTKVMSEILSGSVFVMAETLYFKPEEAENAWSWLHNAAHPSHMPVRRVISSDKGLFTKYGSPDYI